MPRIAFVVTFPLLLALVTSGCTSDTDSDYTCPPHDTWGRIVTHEGDDLEIVLMDGSPAVLHIKDSDLYALVGGVDCYEAFDSTLEPGKEISFAPGAWAESYPPQAWPDAIVVLG